MSSTLWLLKFERSHPFPPPDLAEQAADLCLGILRKTCGATVTVTTDGFAYEQADKVERIFFAVIGLLLLPLTFLLTGLGGHVLGCSDSYRACSQAVFPPVQLKPCLQTSSNLSASMPAQLSPTSPEKKKDLAVEVEAIKKAIKANNVMIKQHQMQLEQLKMQMEQGKSRVEQLHGQAEQLGMEIEQFEMRLSEVTEQIMAQTTPLLMDFSNLPDSPDRAKGG